MCETGNVVISGVCVRGSRVSLDRGLRTYLVQTAVCYDLVRRHDLRVTLSRSDPSWCHGRRPSKGINLYPDCQTDTDDVVVNILCCSLMRWRNQRRDMRVVSQSVQCVFVNDVMLVVLINLMSKTKLPQLS